MDLGIVRPINIESEMQAAYLDYAMSVIVARALPDARDGLKPVHRRILYAMHDLGLTNDKPYKKSARIVGEVLGKYHPHSDVAVYEAMVRMAQDFSLRYPLVDGQGNFGSVDGDNAAAMRYTEARLAAIAHEMLADIDKGTVDWVDNFDGTLKEPSVLPATLPNLLVNGASGIAVGMSTNVPPHNLGEVCDALCFLIDNHHRIEDIALEDLMRFIPGPDFPTGGMVYRFQTEGAGSDPEQVDVIARAYASGRGRIVVQAKAHIEDMSRNRSRIVVTELPYQANKANLLERIAELVRDGRLEGITDLRDESDRTGMRICIEMTRTVEPRDVLGELFKLTPLRSTFSISFLALVDGEPRLLSLKRMLLHYLEHRQDVIVRRSKHDLEKARQRAHILEGLLRALDVLDEIIALIRRSRNADTAKQNLMEQFKFTEPQAQAILDMQLRRLAALERRKLQDEYRDTIALIRELEELLANPGKVLAQINRDLTELKARYGDARRTQIADRVHGTLTATDVLPDQEVWISLGADGMLARQPREPLDVSALGKLARQASLALLPAHTRNDLYLFSAKGQAARVAVHQIPEGTAAHVADLSGLTRRDRVVAMHAVPPPAGSAAVQGYVLLGTVQGKVKRVALAELAAQAHADPQVIALDAGDELVWADLSPGGGEVLLVTASGQAIRFSEEDVRPMGLAAGGIGGIKLQKKDRIVAGRAIGPGADPAARLALLTTAGYGKQVLLSEFPTQGRNGQGVVAAKLMDRSGELAGAALLAPGDFAVCLAERGASYVLPEARMPLMGRATQGKPVVELAQSDRVWEVYRVPGAGVTAPAASAGPQRPRRTGQAAAATSAKAPKAATKAAGTAEAKAPAAPVAKPQKAGAKVYSKEELARLGPAPAAGRPAAAAPAKAPRATGKATGKARATEAKPPAAPAAKPQKAGAKVYSKEDLAKLGPAPAAAQPAAAAPAKAPKPAAKSATKAAGTAEAKAPAAPAAKPQKAGAKVYSKEELTRLVPTLPATAPPAEEPAKSGRKGVPPKETPGKA